MKKELNFAEHLLKQFLFILKSTSKLFINMYELINIDNRVQIRINNFNKFFPLTPNLIIIAYASRTF